MPDRYLKVVETTDNVATALRDISADESVEISIDKEPRTVEVTEDIMFGHKLAIETIPEGDEVTKYGTSIGNATETISPGQWVHTHNVESNYGRGDIANNSAMGAVGE